MKHRKIKIACLEENALEQGFISKKEAKKLGEELYKTEYGQYIIRRVSQWK